MSRTNVSVEIKPPFPAMPFGTEDKNNNYDDDSDGNSTDSEDFNGQNDQSVGDIDVLENSDQAVDISSKSGKVLLLSYSGK